MTGTTQTHRAQRQSWRDIRDRIHGRILSGDFQPGDKLPRDADLAEELRCARSTVQRAMQDLSDSGLIERRRKGGSRVRPDPVTRATLDIPVARKEVESRGSTYGYRLISREVGPPPHAVQAAFGTTITQPMLRVQALHLADARPFILEDRWIMPETVPEALELDVAQVNVNEWLVKHKPYDKLDMRFYAEKAGAERADILGVDPGEALLMIERTTWIDGAPITTVRSSTAPGYQLVSQS